MLGSIPCESFCTEFRKPNEWPTFAPLHDQHRTGFPSIGEALGRCVYVLDTWQMVFMRVRIAAHVKVRASSLAGIGPMFLVMTCGSSIDARFFGTIA